MSTNRPDPWAITSEEFTTWLQSATDAVRAVDVAALDEEGVRDHVAIVSLLIWLAECERDRTREMIQAHGAPVAQRSSAAA
jgi:hypothetical protein